MWATQLALLPTVLSIFLMNIGIKYIGSTQAAITGALEPVTAVAIGVMVFGEALSLRLVIGMVFVLLAVVLIMVYPTRQKSDS